MQSGAFIALAENTMGCDGRVQSGLIEFSINFCYRSDEERQAPNHAPCYVTPCGRDNAFTDDGTPVLGV
jgi:hypothetical protein